MPGGAWARFTVSARTSPLLGPNADCAKLRFPCAELTADPRSASNSQCTLRKATDKSCCLGRAQHAGMRQSRRKEMRIDQHLHQRRSDVDAAALRHRWEGGRVERQTPSRCGVCHLWPRNRTCGKRRPRVGPETCAGLESDLVPPSERPPVNSLAAFLATLNSYKQAPPIGRSHARCVSRATRITYSRLRTTSHAKCRPCPNPPGEADISCHPAEGRQILPNSAWERRRSMDSGDKVGVAFSLF